ncbi:MAG: hypothetical protein GY878_20120 [Fuerstiella sp.]|nr:hypothetical protein [Fuerstiella sp.]
MSNPYQPPTAQTEKRSARPWMILSALLFVALVLMGMVLLRSYRMTEMAREQEQLTRARAQQSLPEGKRCTEGSRGGVRQGLIATSSGLNRNEETNQHESQCKRR